MRKTPQTRMAHEPSGVEQAIVRALRDNLERIQRASDELHHAVNDVVSACSSNKPANALPPLLRAQTSAASLSASLEVISRFVAVSLQTGLHSPIEAHFAELVNRVAVVAPQTQNRSEPVQAQPGPGLPAVSQVDPEPMLEESEETELEMLPAMEPTAAALASESELEEEFDISRLSPEEQELHRRANRVAKVSMQDIKMLRPEQVRLGRQKNDLCIRLKDDIEKAHREYDRRFKPIMDHPVDYFYRWMVEILGDGDARTLGEYPYATPARQR